MKVDPVINNNDQLFISNLAQMQKIKYLQTQKNKRQSYIKDLQQSLALNKQSLFSLVQNNQSSALKKLNQQNILLHAKLKTYYEDYMNVNALLLIQQQLRMESLEFQTKMIQLRKYLQDKEDSFSSVVARLKKYEELAEVTLQTKLHKLSNELAQQHIQTILKKLAKQRDKYKSVFQKFNLTIQDLSFLRNCLEDKISYEAMQGAYIKIKEQLVKEAKQEKGISFCQKTKNTTNASNTFNKNIQTGRTQPVGKNPHRELIRLLKKQKLNNEILQQALNQAIQKNQQLIEQNILLVQANTQLRIKAQKLQSKGYILQQQLTRYDRSLAWKQQWKTKCDIDRQERIMEFQHKGEQSQICMVALQQDMQKLSSFLMTCVPKGKLIKSSSNPNFARFNQNLFQEGDDLQIEQL